MERFHEIKDALFIDNIRNGKMTSGKRQVHISWEQPPEGWVILNTDGASQGNSGRAGGGGVIKGHRGEWLCRFTEGMGHYTSTETEIKAVQLDSRLVVDMLSGRVTWSMEHVPLLRRYMKLIQAPNQVADKLANMGVELHTGCNIYQDPPYEVREVMPADNVRAAWPRMIRS
ncbi:hypothetical protein Cgig2_023325 [Carnegiea gigantea]|uniref:RNase H type-1 domain-containing protein n=1 Tax=Carnegiea gigantea TaxID=171969 RepID=A0A9Q1K369_9CARY|nr:hypothetical protein Cgig2_023325 [Carnegiea gigantea]